MTFRSRQIIFSLLFFISSGSELFAQTALPPFKIVQLGDSYSSGNGARSETGERNYHGVSGCYRSPTSWGGQFADSLKDLFSITYLNRACSGGVIADITTQREIGATAAIDGACPEPDFPEEESYEDSAGLCTRMLAPQINAVDSSVDLVLMTAGGNDISLLSVVQGCFLYGVRGPAQCRAAVDFARAKLGDVESELISTFAEIKARLRPGAKIVFVTYPHLVPSHVPPDKMYVLGTSDQTYQAESEVRLLSEEGDAIQKAAVDAANAIAGEDYIVLFDGTKELFNGRLPTPFQFESPNANSWLHKFVLDSVVESYHFNGSGHSGLGSALSVFETFGAAGSEFTSMTDIDVAFVVDTTGSMGDEIAQVQNDMANLVEQLAGSTDSFRVAIVSYRDFPERTDYSADYASRVDQTFTNDLVAIQNGIDALNADGGGDSEETVFSGINEAVGLPWRPGVTKIAIVIGDAPALSPEPVSGLTVTQIIAASIAVDPVQVIGVDVGILDANGVITEIADGTGGSVVMGITGLTDTISALLDTAIGKPFAWLGEAYSGKVGEPVHFDASGSYDPSGSELSLYEWDFDGDGIFDLETATPMAEHVYAEPFNDFVLLRVAGEGGTALASTLVQVSSLGFVAQGDDAACELDENGYSVILNEQGRYHLCEADSLPDSDVDDGVAEFVGDDVVVSEPEPEPEPEAGLLPAPQRFRYVIYSDSAAELFWDRSVDGASLVYEIVRNGEVVAILDAISYFDDTLDFGADYTYEITAIDTMNNRSASNSVRFMASGKPAAAGAPSIPGGLRYLVYSDTAAELFWERSTDDSDNLIQYEIFIDGIWIDLIAGNSYFVDYLLPANTYSFRIVAVDSDGNRSAAPELIVITRDREEPDNTSPISVVGNVISWPSDGWYQVQNDTDYNEVCGGGTSCEVDPGRYIVINHTTGVRYEGVEVGG